MNTTNAEHISDRNGILFLTYKDRENSSNDNLRCHSRNIGRNSELDKRNLWKRDQISSRDWFASLWHHQPLFQMPCPSINPPQIVLGGWLRVRTALLAVVVISILAQCVKQHRNQTTISTKKKHMPMTDWDGKRMMKKMKEKTSDVFS